MKQSRHYIGGSTLKGKRRVLRMTFFFCCVAAVAWLFHPRLTCFYYAHAKKVPRGIRPYLMANSACLPLGKALLFVDVDHAFGYVTFETISYRQLDYTVKIRRLGGETVQKGRLSDWRAWPWSSSPPHLQSIYIGNEKYPHFIWIRPYCFLTFDRTKILKVRLVELSRAQEAMDDTKSDEWIDTDYIGYRKVGDGEEGCPADADGEKSED